MAPKQKLYGTLGVLRCSSDVELRSAYRRRALETHPDKGGSHEDFLKVPWKVFLSREVSLGRVKRGKCRGEMEVFLSREKLDWGERLLGFGFWGSRTKNL